MANWGHNARQYLNERGLADFGNIQLYPGASAGTGQPATPQPANFNWENTLPNWAGGPGATQQAATAQTQYDVNALNNQGKPNQGNGPGNGKGPGNNPGGTPDAGGGALPIPGPSGDIHGSPEWYGQMNDYGVQQALGSPQGFWGLYGGDTKGWNPSGNAAAFMSSRYDPYVLAGALNPTANGVWDNERFLANMTSIGNQLSGDKANFFDTSQILGGVLNAIASNDDQSLMNANPQLAALINSQKGNPAGQVNTILSFFEQILPSMMPKDMADALLSQMQAVGNQWALGLAHGDIKNLDAANFAQYLIQNFGPALGI